MKAPEGMRDFPPETMILRKEIIEKVERIFIKYGFDPFETPALEYLETMKGKIGEEEKLIYYFQDAFSKKWFALRFDLTVPLARFVASTPTLSLPFKRYQISRVWRHERPQKGRYRELWQCDVDIVGSSEPEADAEIINIINDVMKAFNFQKYTIRINDRRILRGIFEKEFGIESNKVIEVYRAIDKLEKFGIERVKKELRKKSISNEMIERILEVINMKGEPEEVLKKLDSKFGKNKETKKGIEYLKEMIGFVNDLSTIKIDTSMVRGLDYYTGPIYETIVEKPKIGSLTGGGRYNDLIKQFGGRDIPATGTTIGIERLIDAGLELGMFKSDKKTYTQIYVLTLNNNPSVRKYAWEIAAYLRKNGYNVQTDVMKRDQDKQFSYARKKCIPVILLIGEKELKNRSVTIRVPKKEIRKEVKNDEILDSLKEFSKYF